MKREYNEKVRELCSELHYRIPDWDVIFESVKSKITLEREKTCDLGTLVGLLAEYHVRYCLQRRCQNNGINFKVVLGDPGVRLQERSRFNYVNNDGSVKFYDYSNNGILYSQLDYSANIDGIPAFFEVSVGNYANKGGRKNNRRGMRKTRGLKRLLGSKLIGRIFLPLTMSFRDNFTYTIIVARDTMDKINHPYSNLSKLVKSGGIVMPIYSTRKQFREDVLRECKRRYIKFTI